MKIDLKKLEAASRPNFSADRAMYDKNPETTRGTAMYDKNPDVQTRGVAMYDKDPLPR